jgi:hypothetical protein
MKTLVEKIPARGFFGGGLVRAFILAVLVLGGCAPAHYGTTRLGARWESPVPYSPETIDRVIELSAHAFKMRTGLLPPKKTSEGLTIRFSDERVPCGQEVHPDGRITIRTCHGVVYIHHRTILLKAEPCLPRTSLTHELMHLWAFDVSGGSEGDGDPDFDHKDPRLFRDPNAAEYIAIAAALHEDICR